jgi:hypothetical protein
LQCLVAFELKTGRFEPEHLGKLAFYVEALDRDQKRPHENPSVGVLLCRTKDDEVVEYAMSRHLSPAVVAQYETNMIPKAFGCKFQTQVRNSYHAFNRVVDQTIFFGRGFQRRVAAVRIPHLTVYDPDRAIVVNAKVTATNIDTHVSESTRTHSDEIYSFNNLLPGKYQITAGHGGFRQFDSPPVDLIENQGGVVDANLSGIATQGAGVGESQVPQLEAAPEGGDLGLGS